MQINCSKFIIDDAKIVVQKNINKVNILQIEKKQKKNTCTNKTTLLYRCTRIELKLHCCPGQYEGQMRLFRWHLTPLASKFNGGVILEMKHNVGVK